MTRPVLISIAALAAIGALIAFLVAAFQTENVGTPPTSTTTIVAGVETNHRFQQSAATAAEALILTCLSEIPSNVIDDVTPTPGPEAAFRVIVQPALDEDDTDKIRGCLHDFILPNVIGRAESIEHSGRAPAS